MSGITETGFDRKLASETVEDLSVELRAKVSKSLVLDETTALGNVVQIIGNKLGEVWEALEEVYFAGDPDRATKDAMVSIAAITGTIRRLPARGRVICNCVFSGPVSAGAGALICHVDGDSTNRWYNEEGLTDVTGTVAVNFVSERIGSGAFALAGELTEISETFAGWVSVTNPNDATPGTDLETIEELRARRRRELTGAGSAALAAVVTAVSRVTGIDSVVGFENTSNFPDALGIPGHHIEIVIWSEAGYSAAEVGAAILAARAGGIPSFGSTSIAFTDANGAHRERWTLAEEIPLTIAITVTAPDGASETEIQDKILAVHVNQIARGVSFYTYAAAGLEAEGVTAISAFAINGGTSDIAIHSKGIATLSADDIAVTINP